MLDKTVLVVYSLLILAAIGGAAGFWVLNRFSNLAGARFWALVVASALLAVLLLHPSGQAIDELHAMLPAVGP